MMHYQNPILRGFYPDPSICRVEDDYYLVTSTFEFSPGVPLFYSKNLVNWTQIGYCLDGESAVDLRSCHASGGIYAPTIRYHLGMFYMITTNVGGGGHLICHTADIRGEWSKPIYIGLPGIDPSLLFDGDKVYLSCTGEQEGRSGIFVCEIDPIKGTLLTEPTCVSFGCGGKCPEAPHIYHIGDYYYLMIAEGGTEYGHRETIMRGASPYGPYTPCPHNPILFHQERMDSNLHATGHADLVEDTNGNWWLVCLGIRQLPYVMLHHLGRETFLAPVAWQDGWPIVGNQGMIDYEMDAPLPMPAQATDWNYHDDFSGDMLNLRWSYVRNPEKSMYSLSNGKLHLNAADSLNEEKGSPAFVGIRQPEFKINAQAVLYNPNASNLFAGLSVYYNNDYHYDLCVQNENGQTLVFLRRRVHDMEVCGEIAAFTTDQPLKLGVQADEQSYQFAIETVDGERTLLGSGLTAGLCTEGTHTMTFTGVFIGMFSECGTAEFTSFDLAVDE